jgi:hypothetical protein
MSRSSVVRVATASGLTLGLATAGLLLAPSALAAPAAPAAPVVTPASVTAGQATTITISGAGCVHAQPNPAVLAWAGVSFGQSGNGDEAEPNANGTWSVKVDLPAGLPAGTYPVVAGCAYYQGDEGFDYPGTSVTVTAPAAPAAAPATVSKNAKGLITVTAAPGQSLTPDTPAKVGERRTLRLTGYKPGEVVKLVLHSTPQVIGTFTADASGVVVASFIAPAGTPAGDHELQVTRADGSVVTYPIKVSAAKLTPAELAFTGADVAVPLVGGVTLLLVGAGVMFATRRRSAGAAQA